MLNKTNHFIQRLWLSLRVPQLIEFGRQMNKCGIGTSSASIAYYLLLSVFPAAAAGMAIGLFVTTPDQIQAATSALTAYIPRDITDVLITTLSRQSTQNSSNLLFAVFGVGLAIFGVSGAVRGVIQALNKVYRVEETRGFIRLLGVSILLTIGGVISATGVGILLLLSYDRMVGWGLVELLAAAISVVRWPLMIALIAVTISLLFHYGANRIATHWRLSVGVMVATGLWLSVTAAFFWFVQNFAGFTQSYSVFAGVIALMIWFNLGSMAILTGALIDSNRTNHSLK